jgi:hypothetical protein
LIGSIRPTWGPTSPIGPFAPIFFAQPDGWKTRSQPTTSPSALAKAPPFAAFSSNVKATSGGSDAFTILVDDDGNDNDDPGDHLLRVSRDLRIRVAKDLSIGGFDDIPLAFLVLPRLTTIRQPIQEIAEIAVRIVLERRQIDGSVALKPALVERGSSAPPPLS